MKILRNSFLILFLSACTSPGPDASIGSPATLQALKQRIHPKTPVPAGRMESWLQEQIPEGREVRELHATSFTIGGIQRTEGEVVWTDQRGYVALVLTDYAADSLSYLNIFRRYLKESPAEPEANLAWAEQLEGFAWRWQEIGSPIYYLEAGLFDRFHLRLRSNFPVEETFLNQLAAEKNWLRIFSNPGSPPE